MLEPKVRQMIVCEDARIRPGSGGKLDVFGLMNHVKVTVFPTLLTFAVYILLTNARGCGEGRIVVTREGDDEPTYEGDPHLYDFKNDPLTLHSWLIRVPTCPLREPGLYHVELVYNDVVLGGQFMRVEQA